MNLYHRLSIRRKTSTRFKEQPEKSFKPEDIAVKSANVKDDVMIGAARELLAKTLDKQMIENEIATFIKNGFDEKYGPSWNVIVGRNFGSHLSCTEFVQLCISKISVLIFRVLATKGNGGTENSPHALKP